MTVENERERLLETVRRDLDLVRRSPDAWAHLAFAPTPESEGRITDRNRAARFKVLLALQYDRADRDLPLLRFLLQQQITYYREAVPWGLADDLTLAGFLVAEHKQVQDVWLHWAAKSISFDTALGYSIFHLLTPGVEVVLDVVRASAHHARERILHSVGSDHTDVAVQEWLARRQEKFPSDPADESWGKWAHHAARLGEREASRRFMIKSIEGQPRTAHTLNTLQFHLEQLGYLSEAVEVQKEAIALGDSSWPGGRASNLLKLARLERRAGHFADALLSLEETESALPADKRGMAQGIWRHFAKEYFLFVADAPDQATARRLLDTGDRHIQDIPNLWMDGVLDAAIAAAEHLRDAGALHRYKAFQQIARRESDEQTRQ